MKPTTARLLAWPLLFLLLTACAPRLGEWRLENVQGEVAACGFSDQGRRICFSLGDDERVGNHGVLHVQANVIIGYPIIVTFSHFTLLADGQVVAMSDPALMEMSGGSPMSTHQVRWTRSLSPAAGGPDLLKRLENSRTITLLVDRMPVITVASDALGVELRRLKAQRS